MRRLFVLLLFLGLALAGNSAVAAPGNTLPFDADEALRNASEVEIISLEPYERVEDPAASGHLHGYHILGRAILDAGDSRIAVEQFRLAVADWDGLVAGCFDPRHALRVVSGGHTYEFLLCYDCNGIAVFRDAVRLTTLGATGSPQVLNKLMKAKGLELSTTGYQPPSPEDIARKKADMVKWLAGMPASVQMHWDASQRFHSGAGLSVEEMGALRLSLEQEFPDRKARIQSLFRWYGSGVGKWSGYPGWEAVPEKLLLEFDTAELLAALDLPAFDVAQREGAARLFAGWSFGKKRPTDRELLSPELKDALLDHVLGEGNQADEDRRMRARSAFGGH